MRGRRARNAWRDSLRGAALLVCSGALLASSPGTPLDQFLDNLHTLRASFSQVVLDAQGHEIEHGEGTLLVRRPGRFRWEYTPDGEGPQLLVADGTNLWFYDRDLQQATV